MGEREEMAAAGTRRRRRCAMAFGMKLAGASS